MPTSPASLHAHSQPAHSNGQLPALPALRDYSSIFDRHLQFPPPSFFNSPPSRYPHPPPFALSDQAAAGSFGLGGSAFPCTTNPPPRPNFDVTRLPTSPLDLVELPPLANLPIPTEPSWDFTHLASSSRSEPNSDDYLQALVNTEFSSPSILDRSPYEYPSGVASSVDRTESSSSSGPDAAPFGSVVEASQTRGGDDSGTYWFPKREREEEEQEIEEEGVEQNTPSILSSPTSTMPTSRKRSSAAAASAGSNGPTSKRRRPNVNCVARPTTSPKTLKRPSEDLTLELFGSDPEDDKDEVVDYVNLVDVHEDAVVDMKPVDDKSIKLGVFQCVICMDDVRDLVVTYCGHLFCGQCLHSSLHIDAAKKICPICRQKIDIKPANQRSKAAGRTYFPLEIKLMTKNRLGKRPAR